VALTCATCGMTNLDEWAVVCPQCGRDPQDAPRARAAPATSDPPAAPAAPDAPSRESSGCAHARVAGSSLCVYCGSPPVAVLVFPSGSVVVPEDGLILGRTDPVTGGLLGGRDNVSGRHATIERHDDGVVVTDLKSTNGTFVAGRRLLPRESEVARFGETIALGSAPAVRIEVVPEDGS
jgi:hypothetical protein